MDADIYASAAESAVDAIAGLPDVYLMPGTACPVAVYIELEGRRERRYGSSWIELWDDIGACASARVPVGVGAGILGLDVDNEDAEVHVGDGVRAQADVIEERGGRILAISPLLECECGRSLAIGAYWRGSWLVLLRREGDDLRVDAVDELRHPDY